MPFVHTVEFPVRHYECDAAGQLHHANYLRYMQEAAFGASAAVGYSVERYEALGLQWLAYETDLEPVTPARYGDVVQVRTWVADFRRVRSIRHYELTCGETLIARAATDWVLIDAKALKPVSIPPEIIEAYARGDPVVSLERNAPLPASLPPKSGAFETTRRVQWRDIDPAVHVNNAIYLDYVQDCGVEAATASGWTPQRLRNDGITITEKRHFIEYKAAATYGDMLTIRTWLNAIDATSAVRHYQIMRDGSLIGRARTLQAWTDAASGDPIPMK